MIHNLIQQLRSELYANISFQPQISIPIILNALIGERIQVSRPAETDVGHFYEPLFDPLDQCVSIHELTELCNSEDLNELQACPDYTYYEYHTKDMILLYLQPGHPWVFDRMILYYDKNYTAIVSSSYPGISVHPTHPNIIAAIGPIFNKNKLLDHLKNSDRF